MEFVTARWVHIRAGLPISTRGPVEASPYNPLPPSTDGKVASLMGVKMLSRRQETPDIVTFEFDAPATVAGKPFCEAGQFASFDFPGGLATNMQYKCLLTRRLMFNQALPCAVN